MPSYILYADSNFLPRLKKSDNRKLLSRQNSGLQSPSLFRVIQHAAPLRFQSRTCSCLWPFVSVTSVYDVIIHLLFKIPSVATWARGPAVSFPGFLSSAAPEVVNTFNFLPVRVADWNPIWSRCKERKDISLLAALTAVLPVLCRHRNPKRGLSSGYPPLFKTDPILAPCRRKNTWERARCPLEMMYMTLLHLHPARFAVFHIGCKPLEAVLRLSDVQCFMWCYFCVRRWPAQFHTPPKEGLQRSPEEAGEDKKPAQRMKSKPKGLRVCVFMCVFACLCGCLCLSVCLSGDAV